MYIKSRETAEVFREILRLTGLKQNALAEKAGVTPPSINQWLNGKNSIQLDNLIRVTKILNLSISINKDKIQVHKNKD